MMGKSIRQIWVNGILQVGTTGNRQNGKQWPDISEPKPKRNLSNKLTCVILIIIIEVCFVVCDNGFSQIFYNCSNVEEIFSWHNITSSLSQNVQQKF